MKPHTFASIAIGTRFRWVENPIIRFTHCKTSAYGYISQSDNNGSTQVPHDLILRSLESCVEPVDEKLSPPQEWTVKWRWMMDYCSKNGLSPARKEVWDQANRAYDEKDLLKPPRNYKAELDTCVQVIADAASREINARGANLRCAFPDKPYVCQEILEEVIRVLQSRV